MNINIGIHDTGNAKIKREPAISQHDAYAVTTIEIGDLIIDLFHGIEEDPLNTLTESKKGEDNE